MRLALIKFLSLVILGTAGSAWAGAAMAERAAAPEPIRVRVLTIETVSVPVCDAETLHL